MAVAARLGLALVVAGVGAALGSRPVAAQEGGGQVVYQLPVVAPVIDPFRAPATPYGPGNRGIEFATRPGDTVRASADGQVTFAGPVGNGRHVTVAHADGIRTSYSQLQRIDVRVGQPVRRGDPVGRAGHRFHLGARRGDTYIDPASLLSTAGADRTGPGRGELLPLEVPPGGRPTDAPDAVLHGERGWDVEVDIDALDTAALVAAATGYEAAVGSLATRIRLEQHYAVEVNPVVRAVEVSRSLARRLDPPGPCSDAPAPVRPVADQDRRAVLVGGLGSSSRSASVDDLDVEALGYRPAAVERFTYGPGGRPYGSPDTQIGLVPAALRLAARIEQVADRHPGATVDVYAHSMGGLVTRLALLFLERQGFDLGRLGVVATMGTPHQGADLATAAAATTVGVTGNLGLGLAEELVETGLDPDSPTMEHLSATSPVVEMLREAGPLPPEVELVSIAASGDVVVPVPNTRVEGARNLTVSLVGRQAHGDLVGHPETTGEIARALAGQAPRCESQEEVLREELLGHGISYLEDVAGFTALGGTR